MADIFLSYAREDRAWASRLATALENRGWSVFWDRRIPTGKSFDRVIEQELDAARCVIVLWSQNSIGSYWVKSEAREAARREILYPVWVEDVRVPLEFRALQTARLVDWDPGAEHAEFDQLLADTATTLGPAPGERIRSMEPAASDRAPVSATRAESSKIEPVRGSSVEAEVGRSDLLRIDPSRSSRAANRIGPSGIAPTSERGGHTQAGVTEFDLAEVRAPVSTAPHKEVEFVFAEVTPSGIALTSGPRQDVGAIGSTSNLAATGLPTSNLTQEAGVQDVTTAVQLPGGLSDTGIVGSRDGFDLIALGITGVLFIVLVIIAIAATYALTPFNTPFK